MQRQSLGSPSSKQLQIHGAVVNLEKEEKRMSLISAAAGSPVAAEDSSEEDEEFKTEKMMRSKSKADRSIHLIPILTLLCFLILYLCSHDPSPKDLSADGGFSALADLKGTSGKETGRFVEAEKTSAAAALLRGHRVLKEAGRLHHRKMGNP